MHGQAGAARRDTPAAEVRDQPLANQEPGMREHRVCSAERKQPIGLLGRTEPSPSGQDGPPSKPNRACKPPSRARAEGLLGLLGLITGLLPARLGIETGSTRVSRY